MFYLFSHNEKVAIAGSTAKYSDTQLSLSRLYLCCITPTRRLSGIPSTAPTSQQEEAEGCRAEGHVSGKPSSPVKSNYISWTENYIIIPQFKEGREGWEM